MTKKPSSHRYFNLSNFKTLIWMLLCALLTTSSLYFYLKVNQSEAVSQKERAAIVELTNQLEMIQVNNRSLVIENAKILEDIRAEDELKINSFAAQALSCLDIKKKLNL